MQLVYPDRRKSTSRRWMMNDKKRWTMVCLARMVIFLLILFMAGCSHMGVPQWTGSGFLRKEFSDYKKVAVLPFEGDPTAEVSQNFVLSFNERFPQIEVVGPQKLKTFRGQDAVPGQIDAAARAKIGEVTGAQAIILGQVYYPSILSWFLQVWVVNTETGETLGQAYVEINHMGAEGMKEACRLVLQELKPI
jgi:hypothetical protein